MAFKRIITERLHGLRKISPQTLTNCRISSSSVSERLLQRPSTPNNISPDPGDTAVFRRYLHKRPFYHPSPDLPSPLLGETLINKLRAMDTSRNRLRLDALAPPPEIDLDWTESLTVQDARKLLRAGHLGTVKSRIWELQKSCVPYSEFIDICGENCSDPDQAKWIAKMLDESATVIIIGDVVYLRPQQVTKAIQGLLPPAADANPSDPRREELEVLERKKAAIDQKVDSLVRRELWCGLGFLLAQTVGFMRLTFWELSWDVMEPICFYVTSIYFMAGYTFFMRTSKEPSFEGFYEGRFRAKQERLMKLDNFDIERYRELKKAFHPSPSASWDPLSPTSSHLESFQKMQIGGLNHY